jgi:hypothetical protein
VRRGHELVLDGGEDAVVDDESPVRGSDGQVGVRVGVAGHHRGGRGVHGERGGLKEIGAMNPDDRQQDMTLIQSYLQVHSRMMLGERTNKGLICNIFEVSFLGGEQDPRTSNST